MDINVAKRKFKNILNSLKIEDRVEFLAWCEESFKDAHYSKAYVDLRVIAEDIKTMVPLEAILPSEIVNHSQMGIDLDGVSHPVIHVDSFLFEEDDIDELEEKGELQRKYCCNCKSFNLAPTTFISHSASVKRIEFIFQNMLPDLTNKVFLDVGSRLGAILYGAYYCSSAQKIIGIEINEDFCNLQKHIISKYGLNDRIEIICDNICNVPEVMQSANVIVFNNVFECFMPQEMQQKIWIWLRNTISVPGTIIITVPSLEDTLRNLQTEIDISSWVRKLPVEDLHHSDDPYALSEACSYVVL